MTANHQRAVLDQLTGLATRIRTLEGQLASGRGLFAAFACTSTTRPSSPSTGMEIFETDTGNLRTWTGSAWEAVVHTGAWTPYTPSFNGTVGNGFIYGRWSRSGRSVTATINLDWGTSTAGASVFEFGLPVAASSALGGIGYVGSAYGQSFASFNRAGIFIVNPGGTVGVPVGDNDNGWSATDPQTWGNGDQLGFTVTYEAAS